MNLSRVDPSSVCVVDSRLVLPSSHKLAACITIGFVGSSHLTEYMERPKFQADDVIKVHQVSVKPFSQFYRQESAMWGLQFQSDNITATLFQEGLSFSTRTSGQNSTGSVPSSPCKHVPSVSNPRLIFVLAPTKWVNRSKLPTISLSSGMAVSAATPSRSVSIPRSLGLLDKGIFFNGRCRARWPNASLVPIYDGRVGIKYTDRGFDFQDEDFDSLFTWPQLRVDEVPDDAAVAVGYSLSSFKPQNASAPSDTVYLSTNLLFVIVLGLVKE